MKDMQEKEQNYKILLLEDDPSLRQVLVKVLEESGYHPLAVQNGEMGVRALRSFYPDMIVSDVLMPKMNGIEFLKYIRTDETFRNIPFIILSAKTAVADRIEGLQHGADDYISKPFDIQEMLLRIKNTLDLKTRSEKNTSPSQERTLDSRSIVFLRKLNEYLINNIIDPDLHLDKVSDALAMSPSGLQKKIKRLSDKSFTQYVREKRLEYAKELLDFGALNVNEVAEKSGFRNVSYFSDAFRKYYGYPPSHLIK